MSALAAACDALAPPEGSRFRCPDPDVARIAALDAPPSLTELAGWVGHAPLLYVHVPLCAQRCPFCSLFAGVRAGVPRQVAYVDAVARQAQAVAAALGPQRTFSAVQIGGGTPTALDLAQLERLLDVVEGLAAVGLRALPVSVEASPETVTPARVDLLLRRGVSRVALGVQSFIDAEVGRLGRVQRWMTVQTALEVLRASGVPLLDVDLICGIPGQTPASWQLTLECALEWRPQELHLHPLTLASHTALAQRGARPLPDAVVVAQLDQAAALLASAGYRRRTLRHFVAEEAWPQAAQHRPGSPGVVGLGPGACTEAGPWLVGQLPTGLDAGVEAAVDAWGRGGLHPVGGVRLTSAQQQRRRWLPALLDVEGVEAEALPTAGAVRAALDGLVSRGLAEWTPTRLRLTAEGLGWSGALAAWLAAVEARR